MILDKDMRKLLIFSCFFTTYIIIGALVFQALEISNEIKERSLLSESRKCLTRSTTLLTKIGTNLKPFWSIGTVWIQTPCGVLVTRLFLREVSSQQWVSNSTDFSSQGACYHCLSLMLSSKLCSFESVAACSTPAYEAMQLKSYIYEKQQFFGY